MSDGNQTIADLLNAYVGGAFTTVIAATMGRIMFHAQEVRRAKRKPFGKELFWELPAALGIGMLADGVSGYLGVSGSTATAIAVGLGYLGPRGIEALFQKWFEKKIDK